MGYYNCEGFHDPTAGIAISHVRTNEKKKALKKKQRTEYEHFLDTIKEIKKVCDKNGFILENHV